MAKKIILITGDLATGKSTFAKIVSNKYSVNFFNKDSIKEVLGDTIGFANREENLKLSKASIELMMLILDRFISLKKPLILESNFHANELIRIQSLAIDNGYDVMILSLNASDKILHERYLKRATYENRHRVHLSTPFSSYNAFCEYLNTSRKDLESIKMIKISADDFSYQTDEQTYKIIDKFLMR